MSGSPWKAWIAYSAALSTSFVVNALSINGRRRLSAPRRGRSDQAAPLVDKSINTQSRAWMDLWMKFVPPGCPSGPCFCRPYVKAPLLCVSLGALGVCLSAEIKRLLLFGQSLNRGGVCHSEEEEERSRLGAKDV
eukprot:TCALIF_12434-PB protein Name:"Protein of unknown function" AED:0.86 eAED:1.00 QI:0/0/0/0.5/0/0.5/2/0/134